MWLTQTHLITMALGKSLEEKRIKKGRKGSNKNKMLGRKKRIMYIACLYHPWCLFQKGCKNTGGRS